MLLRPPPGLLKGPIHKLSARMVLKVLAGLELPPAVALARMLLLLLLLLDGKSSPSPKRLSLLDSEPTVLTDLELRLLLLISRLSSSCPGAVGDLLTSSGMLALKRRPGEVSSWRAR